MLSETQRNYLVKRNELDDRKVRNNDYAVRSHFKKFLESVEDVNLILDNLPKRQLERSITNENIINVLNLSYRLLELYDLDFGYALKDYDPFTGNYRKIVFSESDPIMRDALRLHIDKLNNYYNIIEARANLAGLIPQAKQCGQTPKKHKNVDLDVEVMRRIFSRSKKEG